MKYHLQYLIILKKIELDPWKNVIIDARWSSTFKILVWNCYFMVLKDLPEINNAVEGWFN